MTPLLFTAHARARLLSALVCDQKSKSSKKRTGKEMADTAANFKRQRSASAKSAGGGCHSGGGGGVGEEDDLDLTSGVHQIKAAYDRPSDPESGGFCERNRYAKDQLIEVYDGGVSGASVGGEWRLAVVRGCNEQGLYTVQYEPVEQNRHKQTGVAWANTRVACMHEDCRQHQLFLAALPLFCDRSVFKRDLPIEPSRGHCVPSTNGRNA